MNNGNIVIVNCETIAERVKVARVVKHLRQVDVACQAGVSVGDVINLEKNRIHIVPKCKMNAILKFLDLLEPEAANNG